MDLETAVAEALPPTLTTFDRCDRCGAQAYVKIALALPEWESEEPPSLLFCSHHYTEHEHKLALIEAVVDIDNRLQLEKEEAHD